MFGPPAAPVAASCTRMPAALTATPHLGAVLSVAVPPTGMAATLALLASLAKTAFALLGLVAGAAGIAYGTGFIGSPAQSLQTAAQVLDLPPSPASGTTLLPFAGPNGGAPLNSTVLGSQVQVPLSDGPKTRIGTPTGSMPPAVGAEVPEPASLPLLLLVIPAMLLARRPH